MREIDQTDIDHWHEHGYAIIERFLSEAEMEAVQENLYCYMPTWDEYVARAPAFADLHGSSNRSSPGWVRYEFPYINRALNRVALHPFLVAFAERLVGHDRIALSHGAIVGKYAGKGDYDQELHPDYSNNTLAFPKDGVESVDIPMIVYHTDVTIDLGPTYVVSKKHTRRLLTDGRRFHSRREFPELYVAETPATVPAGSVLIYDMRTFHRGSAMRAAEGMRFSQFVAFHTTGPSWLGSTSFQGAGGAPAMDDLISHASPRERELIGFPAPSDPYWDEETIVPVVNQVELHPRFPQQALRAYHAAHGILTEAWAPIGQGQGLLGDKTIIELAARKERSPAQVVLRWHMQLGNVVIPKSVTPARIRENIDIFGFALDEDEMQQLNGLATQTRIGPDPDAFNVM